MKHLWFLPALFLAFPPTSEANVCNAIVAKACEGFPKKVTKDPTGSYNGDLANDMNRVYRASVPKLKNAAAEIGNRLHAGKATQDQLQDIETELTDDFFDGAIPGQIRLSGEERRQLRESSAYKEVRKATFRLFADELIPKREFEAIGQELWPKIRNSMFKVVRGLGGGPSVQSYLYRRIDGTPWGGDACNENDNLPELLAVNAYNDGKHGVVVCPGWLRANSSRFSSTMVIAHELAHSIDLCAITTDLHDDPKLLAEVKTALVPFHQCLTDPKSVGAKPDAGFCSQQKEAFADFLGAEVINDLIQNGDLGSLSPEGLRDGMINVWRSGCGAHALDHPSTGKRLDRITLAHPGLRQQLGCPKANARYCGAFLKQDAMVDKKDTRKPAKADGVKKPALKTKPKPPKQ